MGTGRIMMTPGGGSADLDAITAEAGDVLAPKVIVDQEGEPVTGTLSLTGSAADSQVLSGQTYYNTDAKTKRTGSMQNRGAWNGSTAMNGNVTVPAGFHNGAGKVTGPVVTQRGAWTGTAAMNGRVAVPEGYHNGGGYVNGPAITNRGGYGGFGNNKGNDAGNQRMWVQIPGGYYNDNANVYLSWADIRNLAGLTAGDLRKGVSKLGVTGNFEGYVSSPLYLYNNGTWSGLSTTGTTGTSGSTGMMSLTPYRVVSGSNITYHDSIIRLNSVFNLTPYNYIKITYKGPAVYDYETLTMYLGVSTSSGISSLNFTAMASYNGQGTLIANVSAISGNHYIYIGARSLLVSNYARSITVNTLQVSTT